MLGDDADLFVTDESDESGDLKGDLNGFEAARLWRILECVLFLGCSFRDEVSDTFNESGTVGVCGEPRLVAESDMLLAF